MKYPAVRSLFLFFCLLWGGSLLHAQFRVPPRPMVETSVYDYVDLLKPDQKTALRQKLINYADSTSTQIVVAVIGSTDGRNIQELGVYWLNEWGIGQKGKDNGILVILARDDRRVGINTGKGVEGKLTDAMSRRIIETVMIPEFREGDYYSGLDRGTDAIFLVMAGEFTADPGDAQSDQKVGALIVMVIFIIIIILLIINRRGGGRGPDLWDIIILSNMGRGGFGGGSSSGGFGGGGFGGGFGGGMGGGGGASGGW